MFAKDLADGRSREVACLESEFCPVSCVFHQFPLEIFVVGHEAGGWGLEGWDVRVPLPLTVDLLTPYDASEKTV